MATYNEAALKHLESVARGLGYRLRYEKGNFKSGECLIHQTHVVLINKFVSLEQKINALIDVIAAQEEGIEKVENKYRGLFKRESTESAAD